MARNPVQFQKGISLNEFLSLYGTDDQCFDALYRWRWPNGFVCPHCGHDRCCQLNSRKLQQCNRCHRQTSITAGTIFDSTKLALTVWFQAIYLMTQDKKGVSAMKLHRHLGISYNAAWRIRHKLMQVMMERDREHPLSGWIELDDAYLGGERSGGKRGRGAPGKTPFVAAVQTNEQGHPLRMKLTVVEGFQKWTPGIGQCGKWNLPRVSGCQIAVSLIEVHRIGGASVQCAVTAPGVVETEVAGQTCPKLGGRFVGTQVHVLVLDAAPQTLDEHVVHPSALAIHADRDGVTLEHVGERVRGELAPLDALMFVK